MLKEINLHNSNISAVENILKTRAKKDLNKYKKTVQDIIDEVKKRGDQALFKYTLEFDKVKLDKTTVKVSKRELKEAVRQVEESYLNALKNAARNIEEFHKEQKDRSWQKQSIPGKITGQICRPLQSSGIYVPGGRASYPSSVLMTAIPAKVAGVEKVIMVSPPDKNGKINPKTLAAAKIAGVDEIYKVGGAQAIAALAYKTKSVPKVDIIVGPGNIYVTLAKKLVFGEVKIDMTAGPSEILIFADRNANSRYIAADLLSQAEHDPLASSILVTESTRLITKVKEEIKKQLVKLDKKDIIKESLKNYGLLIKIKEFSDAVKLINQIAPEHLELIVEKPFDLLPYIKNAGSIFLGEYSPEPMGDYYAGPNHVLPTEGTASFFSPLSVRDFIKFSSYIYYSKEAFDQAADDVITLAQGEGLTAHANSIEIRKKSFEVDDNED